MSSIFSVVTPTSNSLRYLDETIQSVVFQRGKFHIDYVVIDNCSTDGTLELLKKYQDDISNDIIQCNCDGVSFRFVSEKDEGMYEAVIKGMKMCNGDYFSYINSDDFYLPNAFATVDRVFNKHNVNWITGLPGLYDDFGAIRPSNTPCVYKSSYIRSGVYGKQVPHIQQESTFWKKEMCDLLDFEKLSEFKYAGDFYIWYVFAETNILRTVNAQFAGFRFHPGNKSNDLAAYNLELNSLNLTRLGYLDYAKIQIYKRLFGLMGNKLLPYFPKVISLD